MQKKRPRRKGEQSVEGGAFGHTPGSPAPQDTPDPAGRGRPKHVRSRLIVAVAVVAAAIAGAGAPSVIAASGELNDSQNLVTSAERTKDALALAHSLSDERDEVTSYLAAGRPKGKGPSERRSARVDRQVDELRVDAVETDAPAAFLETLDGIAAVRRAALTGQSSALQAHQAYSAALTELHALAEELAEDLPPRAGSGAHALADLDTAVQQAASTRGLLLAALSVPTSTQTTTDPITGLPTTSTTSSAAAAKQRDALTAAAQQANVREQAALADFAATAPKADRASYDSTVNGPDVTSAEKYLADLADRPTLSDAELATATKKLDAALSARVELMRGVQASLNTQRAEDLAQLRDDDVTALEIRIAVLGALMLLAVGVSTGMARSLTRPLSVLRRGSARLAAEPGTGEPVTFTGRNDEFAQVVRSVNTLHAHAVALNERLATLEGDRKHLIGQRQKMADERDTFRAELAEATTRLEQLRSSIHGTFVSLALRTLGLVERQLGIIEGLEEREQDPERLATLFRLDHFATVMRRHSENLLVLAGAEHGHQHPGPVPLVDVVRAAVSEVERYERIRISALPPHAHLAGFAADDISHLVAELLENASSFSPPDVPVEVSGWLLESGEVMLSVQDEGIGMTSERLERLNTRLTSFDPQDAYDEESGDGLGLGLYVVARLAHRHGVRVRLREQSEGGVTAVVVLPKALLAAGPTAAVPSSTSARTAGAAPSTSLPGADAEVNSNVLDGRQGRDPLIAAAEDTLREADEAAGANEADGPDGSAPDGEAGAGAAGSGRPAPRTPDRAGTGSAEPAAPARASGTPGGPETTMVLMASVPPADEPAEPATAPAGPTEPAEPGAGGTAPGSATGFATGSAAVAAPRDPAAAAPPGTPSGTSSDPDLPPVRIPAQATAGRRTADPYRTTGNDRAADPYAIGPDTHERAPDASPGAQEPAGPQERVTDKGLPKRTPKISAPARAAGPRPASVDAEALRRRLGGFHRGASEGRRDVEAEITEQTSELETPAARAVGTKGDTVEEASS